MSDTRIVCYESLGDFPVIFRDSLSGFVASISPADLLRYLLNSNSGHKLRVFWDIDSALANLFKLLPLSVVKELATTSRAKFCGYKLFYAPNSVFGIDNSSYTANYYSLSRFFPEDHPAPSSLSETQALADSLMEALSSLGTPSPDRLASPVSVLMSSMRGKEVYDSVPTITDTPDNALEAQEYAMRCNHRLWVSCYQIGSWGVEEGDELYTYDMTGAFPSEASKLLDVRQMQHYKSTDYDTSAYYGFLRGRLTIDPDSPYAFCHPFLFQPPSGLLTSATGPHPEDFYTLSEIRYLYRYNLGTFDLADAWYLKPYNGTSPSQPLKPIMSDLYSQRSLSPLASSVAKNMANGLIGKLAEHRRSQDGKRTIYGDLFNPIYHAIITTEVRLRDFDFLVQNQITPEELVHIMVDGCRLTRYLPLPVQSRGLGSWKCLGSSPTIVLSPTKVYSGSRRPGSLTYSDLLSLITEHPQSSRYEQQVPRRITLPQALAAGDLSLVGELSTAPASVDLRTIPSELDRVFKKLPRTGKALLTSRYQSKPIQL